jgi:para-aminobenzoate synthetase component 1
MIKQHREVTYKNPFDVFAQIAHEYGAIFFDSSQHMSGCGRYSFIATNPFLILRSKNNEIFLNEKKCHGNPWDILNEKLLEFSGEAIPDLPPFQGGAAGFFSYDLSQHLENISSTQKDDMNFPDMMIGFYDEVMAFDHELERAWCFSTSLRARQREAIQGSFQTQTGLLRAGALAMTSNFTQNQYISAVTRVKEHILAGDIFEANISQRFHAEFNGDPFELYSVLRQKNPAPFSAYLSFGDVVLASASPERFLQLKNHHVETRPIKGTCARGKTSEEDEAFAKKLLQSEKDRAENIMIVDLLRNDLSKVCEPHSVKVPKLCGLETYANVHHLVSVVTGTMKKNFHAVDLLKATFPGGSITGAPKIRAMEIIADIEPTKRGPYCGCIGYIGFDGSMDTSITIRTFAIHKNDLTFQAGGAVTMDSDPLQEYEETLTKVSGLKAALRDACCARSSGRTDKLK